MHLGCQSLRDLHSPASVGRRAAACQLQGWCIQNSCGMGRIAVMQGQLMLCELLPADAGGICRLQQDKVVLKAAMDMQ